MGLRLWETLIMGLSTQVSECFFKSQKLLEEHKWMLPAMTSQSSLLNMKAPNCQQSVIPVNCACPEVSRLSGFLWAFALCSPEEMIPGSTAPMDHAVDFYKVSCSHSATPSSLTGASQPFWVKQPSSETSSQISEILQGSGGFVSVSIKVSTTAD